MFLPLLFTSAIYTASTLQDTAEQAPPKTLKQCFARMRGLCAKYSLFIDYETPLPDPAGPSATDCHFDARYVSLERAGDGGLEIEYKVFDHTSSTITQDDRPFMKGFYEVTSIERTALNALDPTSVIGSQSFEALPANGQNVSGDRIYATVSVTTEHEVAKVSRAIENATAHSEVTGGNSTTEHNASPQPSPSKTLTLYTDTSKHASELALILKIAIKLARERAAKASSHQL